MNVNGEVGTLFWMGISIHANPVISMRCIVYKEWEWMDGWLAGWLVHWNLINNKIIIKHLHEWNYWKLLSSVNNTRCICYKPQPYSQHFIFDLEMCFFFAVQFSNFTFCRPNHVCHYMTINEWFVCLEYFIRSLYHMQLWLLSAKVE